MESKPTYLLVVAAALPGKSGTWLMYRRPAGKRHAGLWEFPGGKVERAETPAAALCREIKEELDVSLAPSALEQVTFACEDAGEGHPPLLILLYKAADWSGEPRAMEGGEIGWFTPEEIAGLDRPPLDIALTRQFFA